VFGSHLRAVVRGGGIEIEEVVARPDALEQAEAVFITSSGRELASVNQIDDRRYEPLGRHPLGRRIYELLDLHHPQALDLSLRP
jgi:branched-subunit amino acid aminotransferase/4-amino-4-deoxychorismate lyase